MRKAFKGCKLPSESELAIAIVSCRQSGEPDVRLTRMLIDIASNTFETDLRKNCDYFLMEEHAKDIVNTMVLQALKDCTKITRTASLYSFFKTTMKGAFIGYMHKELSHNE